MPEGAPTPLVRQNMQLDVGGRLQLRYVRDISPDDATPDKVVSGALRLGAGALEVADHDGVNRAVAGLDVADGLFQKLAGRHLAGAERGGEGVGGSVFHDEAPGHSGLDLWIPLSG